MAVNIGPRIGIEGEAEYRKQLNNIIQQTKTLHSEMRSMESAWNKDTSAKEKAAQQTRMLNQQIDTQKQRIDELRKGVEQSAAAYGENDTKTLKWKQALADAETELHRLQSELQKVPNNVQILGQSMQETGKKMQEVGKGISSVGSTLTKSVTAPIAALGIAAVKTTADFDSSMSKVAALSNATEAEFEALRQKARDMGATTKYSAGEAADALSYMALAGWDTNQMIDGLDGVLNLAAASGMELAEASDLVTDYLSAFGLQASDSSRMADQLAYAQAHSNTTTTQLGEAFGNTAAQMHTAGQSMETTTAILEAFANQGLKGSEAGTALSAMVRDITQKMKNGKIYIGETAITVQDANGNFRNMIDILADVEKATDGMGSAEKSAALMTTFTARSVKGVSMALTEGSGNIRKYEDDLNSAGGTAKNMAEVMQDNLAGQLTILKSQVQELGISFGDILVPKIRSAVEWVQEQVDKFNKLDKSTRENIVKFGLLAAAVGPVLSITGKLVDSTGRLIEAGGNAVRWIGNMIAKHGANAAAATADATATGAATVAQNGLNAAMLASPIGAIALAITGAVAAIIALKKGYDRAKKSALEANEELHATVTATERSTEAMEGAASSLRSTYDEANDSIGQVLSTSQRATVLADDIAKLTRQEKLNAEEKARMQAMVSELNGLYPSLSLEIDENTGKTKQNASEIRNLVAEAANMQKVEIYNKIIADSTEALGEAYKARAQASWEAQKAEEQATLSDAERAGQIARLEERIKSATGTERENMQAQLDSLKANGAKSLAHIAAEDAIRAEEKAEQDLTTAIEENEGFMKSLQKTLGLTDKEMAEYSAKLEETSGALDEAGDDTEALTLETEELSDELEETADEISEYSKEIIDAYNSTADSARSSVMEQKGMFEQLEGAEEKSIADMVAGLQSHVTAYQNWNDNVSTMMNSARYQTDEGFRNMVNSVASAGIDMAPELQAIVTAFQNGDSQLEDLVQGYGNLQQLSVETGQNTAKASTMLKYGINDMNAAFREGGITVGNSSQYMVDAATRPLTKSQLQRAAREEARATVSTMSRTLNSSEPSKAVTKSLNSVTARNEGLARQTGRGISDAYGSGVQDGTGGIQTSGNKINTTTQQAIQRIGSQKAQAQAAGRGISQAVSQGIQQGSGQVNFAINTIKTTINTGVTGIRNLSNTARSAGTNIANGIVTGVNGRRGALTAAMTSLRTAVNSGISAIGSMASAARSRGTTIAQNVASGINAGKGGVQNAAKALGQSVSAGLNSSTGSAKSAAQGVANAARQPLSSLGGQAQGWGYELGRNFANGIANSRPSAIDEARKTALAVSYYLKHSTPKLGPLHDDNVWGYHMGQNFAQGMARAIPLVEAATAHMANAAVLPTVDTGVVSGAYAAAENALTTDMIFDAFSAAMDNLDIGVTIGSREFGRILREYGAIA